MTKNQLIAIPLICLVTYLVTSHVMITRGKNTTAADDPDAVVPIPAEYIISDSSVEFSNANPDGTVSATGMVVPIKCSLSFYDTSQDQTLTWFLTVKSVTPDENGDYPVFFQQTYQTFVVPKGVTVSPTFADDVTLPPGTYVVHCGVNEQRDTAFEVAGNSVLTIISP